MPGLTDAQLDDAERAYGIRFCANHRAFLRLCRPVGKGWYDWRKQSSKRIRTLLEWPRDGMLIGVRQNVFWPSSWGERPEDPAQAIDHAVAQIEGLPKLIPLFGHRFMAAGIDGSAPVFSVYQSDVIYSGSDLVEWVQAEFSEGTRSLDLPSIAVPFWSALAEGAHDDEL